MGNAQPQAQTEQASSNLKVETQNIKNSLAVNQEEIFKKILDISNALIMEYNNEFLKNDFCEKIALVYEKKLSNFNIKVLRNLNYLMSVHFKENKQLKDFNL